MSLLLKALQNAAKNREAGTAGEQPDAATTPATSAEPNELSLEPIEPAATTAEPARRVEPTARPKASTTESAAAGTERNARASRTQAQNVFLAGARTPPPGESATPGIVEWLTRRPLIAFSTAAGLFAIGYGVYLYLQLTNPGIFIARQGPMPVPPPQPAPAPPVQAPVPPPVAAAPGSEISAAPGPTAAVDALPGSAPATPTTTPAAPPGSDNRTSVATGATPPAAPAPSIAMAAPADKASAAPAPRSTPAPSRAGTSGPSSQLPASKAPGERAPIPIAAAPRTAPAAPNAATRRPAAQQRGRPASSPAPVAAPSVSADLLAAYQALEKGQLDDSERLYRQALATDPRSVDAMIGLGATLTQQNRADAATQIYLRALEVEPQNSYAQAGLLSIGGRADPQAAEIRLKQLIAREPSAFLYFTLGNLYAEQNQWAAAQGAYFQAFTLAPDNPDYAFNLAVGLEHLSQPKLALDYYRRAVTIAQARGNAQFALAPVQSRIRSLEAALAEQP